MSTKSRPSRYRIEGDQICIDIRLRSARQLFDGRDPAPFRERDLDQNAVVQTRKHIVRILAAQVEVRGSQKEAFAV